LLEDIDAHHIDCIIVYKVDRLSRSLLDFARLVDRFDQRSVSFVSVTQQFNTTSSLGRLTLNILLSFAQFEREIIGERTRDKMSAARRKGKWVGGTPVLGYDVDPAGGRLIVNEKESRRVRDIFALFAQHRSLSAVVAELAQLRWKTKSWKSQNGRAHAGRSFAKVSLRRLLTNPIYAGQVEHRGAIYKGEHAAIIEPSVWQEVNAELRAGYRTGDRPIRAPQNALLANLLLCKSCQRPMVPTYTAKPGRRYRYYVCRGARQNGWSSCPTKSVPAQMIEEAVVEQLRTALRREETREELRVSEADWQSFEEGHFELARALVKQVSYDGATGAVALNLMRSEVRHED
jgi:site-specific DNA recombinase